METSTVGSMESLADGSRCSFVSFTAAPDGEVPVLMMMHVSVFLSPPLSFLREFR